MWRIFPQVDDDIAYTMDDEQMELLKKLESLASKCLKPEWRFIARCVCSALLSGGCTCS